MTAPPPAKKNKPYPPRPLWLCKLSWRTFPRGPRALYIYLAAFTTGQCWLYNYRLAATFDVSPRSIQLWLAWLTRFALIHIYWLHGKQRRIVIHHYRNSYAWLAAAALPKPKKKYRRYTARSTTPQAWSAMTPAQFSARREALIAKLFERK